MPPPPPPPPSPQQQPPNRPVQTIRERIENASTAQKASFFFGASVVLAFLVVFFVYERQVFEFLEPAVSYIRTSSAGIPVLASIMAATCIFPLLGYGVVSMICGYVYGIPKGFLPAFVGDIVGASICFWLYRLVFHEYINRKFKDNIEFREMSKAVMLNAYFGAMTLLPYWKFILATAMSTPRLFIALFIGQNISSLADPTIKGKDRIIKWGMNFLGVIIALAIGWYIYRHTKRRIERINAGLAPDESEEEETVGLGRQQQHQRSDELEHADHDSFDLQEMTPHKYVGVATGHVEEIDTLQGYSRPPQRV